MSGVTVFINTCNHSGSSNTSKSVSGSVVVVSHDGSMTVNGVSGLIPRGSSSDTLGSLADMGGSLSDTPWSRIVPSIITVYPLEELLPSGRCLGLTFKIPCSSRDWT